MRALAEAWGHNVRLLDYLITREEREWYARGAIEHGFSRNVLVHHIETRLYERQGQATTNFERPIPAPQSDLARQLLKDPSIFEFLTLQHDAEESELEKGLMVHLKLRCYVFINLKTGKFKPEYAGKINFYLAVVGDLLRHPDDAPSTGLFHCRDQKKVIAEYALRNMASPIGISEYQITESLPDTLKNSLPTVAQLEQELAGAEEGGDGEDI